MKRKLFFILLFLLAEQTGIPNAFSQGGSFMDLNVYRWKNRLLMVFTSFQDDPNYQSLTKEMQGQQNGLQDRDILVFEILEKGESRLGNSPLKKVQLIYCADNLGFTRGNSVFFSLERMGRRRGAGNPWSVSG
jgi:hypothetical protein